MRTPTHSIGRLAKGLFGLLALACLGPRPVAADEPFRGVAPLPPALEPASTGGVAAVDRALARLSGHRRLLLIGAHPDDEDNALLTWVSLSGGDAAYLSLSRGEGGQNLVGPELGVPLGLLRTGELLAARRIDGARQFFTRAYDFGYTRSLAETERRWPPEAILEDAVRVVRRFQPQVIVALFPPDERAGHGQHQMSAVIAREAFSAAGSPDRYPHLTAAGLPPWTPSAFFRRAWSLEEITHRFSLDAVEPFSGRSMAQVAAASRSQHRSQDMGREQPIGGGSGGLVALDLPIAGESPSSLDPFSGIDTRLSALAALLPEGEERARLEARLTCVENLARSLRARLAAANLDAAVPELAVIAHALDGALASWTSSGGEAGGDEAGRAALVALLREKRATVGSALLAAAGVAVEAVVDRETISPGETARVTVSVWNGGRRSLTLSNLGVLGTAGWRATSASPMKTGQGAAESHPIADYDWEVSAAGESRDGGRVTPGELRSRALEIVTESGLAPSTPYFLAGREPPRAGLDLHDWSGVGEAIRGEPWAPPLLAGRFGLEVAGVGLEIEREVVFRTGDQAIGEVRRPLRVVPGVEVLVDPDKLIRPLASGAPWTVEVRLHSHLDRAATGRLVTQGVLSLAGSSPGAGVPFALDPRGSWATRLELARPETLAAGVFEAEIVAELDTGERFASAAPLVDYPHVRPVARVEPARVSVHALDLALPPLDRIGWVVGASDRLPEELAAVGLPIERLDATRLSGDLAEYDAIVVGGRAYETEARLSEVNGRLLDYARAGGLVIVLYQQYPYVWGGYAPFALEIARPHGRVTDEDSPVNLLAPEHPVFHHPNQIRAKDWEGWVQERGLYFASSWDEAFEPLLSMRDPEQPEERGGLLVAPLGSGTYVYTGLAFFRQLPAGVPGAWRLFANLLALGG